MSDAELVDALAGSLELLANQLDALFGPNGETVYVYGVLADLRAQAREAAALAGEPRDDLMEDAVLALRGVQNDWELGHGLGLEPTLHRLTWEKVERVLRRCGAL